MSPGSKPVILITGASKGIGLAVTRILLQKFNANVIAISRSRTQELVSLSCDALLTVQCDIADEHAFAEAVDVGLKQYHTIDGLILNAATVEPMCRIGDGTALSEWRKHFDVGFFSLVTALKLTLPSLRKSQHGGRVVFVSSGSATGNSAGCGAYNASKAAMNSLCRTLAEEEPEITAVALRPGMVDTKMQATLREIGGSVMLEKDLQRHIRAHAEGTLVKPEDSGHVIAALSVNAPKALSGQFISWDSEECRDFRSK